MVKIAKKKFPEEGRTYLTYANFDKYPRGRPSTIYINYEKRHWENKIFYLVYRIWRLFHVSCWFYFLPFTILIITYYWPLHMLKIGKIDSIQEEQEANIE